ncbi:MAG: N-acetylglucosamine-6-phosphate deacetylase [Clostridia bacterium]|nr:N-acetylglucosamine-6-phosphate deacetylase [Clostridia bacterium]
MNIYINGKIILENDILENHILVADHKIQKICPVESYDIHEKDKVIDLDGHYLSPGFINVHIHGSNGYDTMDATQEAMEAIAAVLPASGVTSFLATTMTMPKENIYKALQCAKNFMADPSNKGAELLGIHAEGPFISAQYKGAQDPQYILAPDYKFYEPFYDIIKIITLAPESDLDFDFAKALHEKHPEIVLSIGHSSANYEKAMEAFSHGIRHITHLFNAMTGLHHRNPGIVGAALTEDFYTELIADNIHVRPELYKMLLKAKGKDHLILITDAMCAACLKPGLYELGGQEVIVDETSARLHSGVLAGSILTMDQALRNIHDYTSLTLYETVNLATKNPAEELGLYHQLGSIDIGKDADLVVFDDQFTIKQTYCKGQLTYLKEDTNAN